MRANKGTRTSCLIESHIEEYKDTMMGKNGDKVRGLAFDYCYAYYQKNKNNLTGANMQTSCMQLWSFLANWGMITQGCKLMDYNYKSLAEIVAVIDKYTVLYDIKMDDNDYVDKILAVYGELMEATVFLKQTYRNTLVTKIMLGTFGCCPAFDINFCAAFGTYSTVKLGHKILEDVQRFYKNHKAIFDEYKINVMSFEGQPIPELYYPVAKLVDMYGFIEGCIINSSRR